MVEEIQLDNINSNLPLFILMVGSQGQGKTTYANKIRIKRGSSVTSPNVYSYDDIEVELRENSNGKFVYCNEILSHITNEIVTDLTNGVDAVYDNLNILGNSPLKVEESIPRNMYNYVGVVFNKPVEECLENNKHKSKPLPEKCVRSMCNHNHTPVIGKFNHIVTVTHNTDYDEHIFIIN